MKQKYRFVGGGISNVGELTFSQFGQRAEFSDDFAVEVLLGGAAFIPEEDFQSLSIDPEELARYAGEFYFGEIPAHFDEKRQAAQQMYREHRDNLKS